MNSPNTTDTTPDRDQQAMRQVLMISYDFPPMNGPGALRIAQFAKHLPQAGWEPIIVTVHDGYSSRPLDSASSNQVQARVLRVREFDPIKRLAVQVVWLPSPPDRDIQDASGPVCNAGTQAWPFLIEIGSGSVRPYVQREESWPVMKCAPRLFSLLHHRCRIIALP